LTPLATKPSHGFGIFFSIAFASSSVEKLEKILPPVPVILAGAKLASHLRTFFTSG
jgi:hypothetical protein